MQIHEHLDEVLVHGGIAVMVSAKHLRGVKVPTLK